MNIPIYNGITSDQLFYGSSRQTIGRFVHHILPKAACNIADILQTRSGPTVDVAVNQSAIALIAPTHPSTDVDADSDCGYSDSVAASATNSAEVTSDEYNTKASPARSEDIAALLDIGPHPAISNPILTGADVGDFGDAAFVADPFLFPDMGGFWHAFFEVYNPDRSPDAAIGHAVQTDSGQWLYDRIVLETNYHVSFPYVFEWCGDIYMLPEQHDPKAPGSVKLFYAESFPDRWRPVESLIDAGVPLGDAIVFRHDETWWLLVDEAHNPGTLRAYYSNSLHQESWTMHHASPVVEDRPAAARPAGRPVVMDDRIIVFYQDQAKEYGHAVRAYEIVELDRNTYRDRELSESPLLEASSSLLSWNSGRMHHIDPWYVDGTWYCAVDGNIGFGSRAFTPWNWSIGIYTSPP